LGGASRVTLEAIACYADSLGLAFQIQDDLLDLAGTAAETGKDSGRDRSLGRTTFVTLLGAEAARTRLRMLREEGVRALDRLDHAGSELTDLFDFVISRRS